MPTDPQAIRATRTKREPDSFLNRIPNRNLTEEDWDLLDTDQRAEVRQSALYEVKTNAEMADARAPRRSRSQPAEEPDDPEVVLVQMTPPTEDPPPG